MGINKRTLVGILSGLAMIATGSIGLAATHDDRVAAREQIAIERQVEAEARAEQQAIAEQTALDAEAQRLAAEAAAVEEELAAQARLAEQEALEAAISRKNFRNIPLGATEAQVRAFMGIAPETETTDDEFDLWLHWSGTGRSQINIFIDDDVVVGANYWADVAPGVVSYAQFTEISNLLEQQAPIRELNILPQDLWSLINPISPNRVAETIPFEATRERRLFDTGDEILFLDFPGWGSRVVTLAFFNGDLDDAFADVVDPDDQVLLRARN